MLKQLAFEVTGAYQFTETFTIHSNEPFIHADAGRIAGAWHLKFEDGTSGSCHINGATANRVTPSGASLFGTMQIDMFEVTGDATRTDMLYLAYESSSFEINGPNVDIVVEGEFIGGKGQYTQARGSLRVRSVNGYIEEGSGILFLDQSTTETKPTALSNAEAEAAVMAYFQATQSGDAKQWAERFAEGAVLEDPVGEPVLRGREAILRRGEQFIEAFEQVGLYPEFIQVCGNRASAKWIGRGRMKNGQRVEFEGVNVWEFAPDGRIQKLMGYWDPSQMREVK